MRLHTMSRTISKLTLLTILITLCAAVVLDRVDWTERKVGMINVDLVPALKAECAHATLIDVASSKSPGAMEYRCGGFLFPLYKSGESADLAKLWSSLQAD
ncbi:hypothetical protein D9M68_676900 [compost metagenome]